MQLNTCHVTGFLRLAAKDNTSRIRHLVILAHQGNQVAKGFVGVPKP